MLRRFVIFLGMAPFLSAGPATADEACFVEYHRGFVGEWLRTDVQRAARNGLQITETQLLQRVRWEEPNRLITEILPNWNEAPVETVTQEFTANGIRQTKAAQGDVSEMLIQDISSTCFEGEGGVQGLVISFEQSVDGQLFEFRNSVEISEQTTLLVSMFRPATSDAPYQWNKTVFAVNR